jgi:spore coat protein H
MTQNAHDEVYVEGNAVYNGIEIGNIGIRPKGNSSLRRAISLGKNQYSLRLNFDKYTGAEVFGISDINLNNCIGDPTYIREALAYEFMEYMGLCVPQRVFCNLYINDKNYGVYLAVQQVDRNLLKAWFENNDGDLYKPDMQTADLKYYGDRIENYPGMILKSNEKTSDGSKVLKMIDILNHGGDIEEVLDVDAILKYFAVSTSIVNLDSYQGGMFHNYYLYEVDGVFCIIPWDFNETFMPFGNRTGMGEKDMTIDVVKFLIDEPTSGPVHNYPLIEKLLSVPEYRDRYHKYIGELIEGPMKFENVRERAIAWHKMLDEHVKNDSVPLASYFEFRNSLYEKDYREVREKVKNRIIMGGDPPALLTFIKRRVENIKAQLNGDIPSTNNGQGNITRNKDMRPKPGNNGPDGEKPPIDGYRKPLPKPGK